MNFFDAQDRARRSTRWLVIVYIVATALIVAGVTAVVGAAFYYMGANNAAADPAILGTAAAITALFIVGASLFKTSQLSSGGGRVAADMGGTPVPPDVRDPLRRRLRNVVEEMAIASGVPVPEVYVLESEPGINAFAAGFAPGDAAVAVTRGTLELLDRDELQGVIAHEFSHILNGDMRLNIRLMGVLFGIMVLGLIGRIVLRGGYHGSAFSSRRSKGAPAIMAIGIGLALLGWIGVFFSRLIKAAVSRQREFLADASAVQFTRQPEGIADALKKIGGYSRKSYIEAVDPEEVSHMLFAGGVPRLASLFATHPPLTERIQALDPSFTERDYPEVDLRSRPRPAAEAVGVGGSVTSSLTGGDAAGIRASIADSVGQPAPEHIAFARGLRLSIPDELYAAAHSPELSYLLTLALAMDPDERQSSRQLQLIHEQLGEERATLIGRLHEQLTDAGPAYRLPLLEIAFPMLKSRPAAQLEFLLQLVRRMIDLDGKVDLREYCLYRILQSQVGQVLDPARRPGGNRVSKRAARKAALDLVRVVADYGDDDPRARDHAYAAGTAPFSSWADEYRPKASSPTVEILDRSLGVLAGMNPAGRQSLVTAVAETIMHDGKLTVREAELLRAICATLECPVPPILGADR